MYIVFRGIADPATKSDEDCSSRMLPYWSFGRLKHGALLHIWRELSRVFSRCVRCNGEKVFAGVSPLESGDSLGACFSLTVAAQPQAQFRDILHVSVSPFSLVVSMQGRLRCLHTGFDAKQTTDSLPRVSSIVSGISDSIDSLWQ